ncbi:tetratricopeptide repeat protein [Candidatus Nitronereus thalassa]|uniref:Tetratricopeptide repeat protein n=1 Tax=Candidatus Nitronereus thalassa TaxID=3020898 RepID=A0ABU3KD70_9BACT|nr:tetratricopeptide repeat protein [Candidatus Nitronereus thalassa]MDT7044228.1 tetratricopeptide repeat protein [Candidatus Nitronereus thalassa]
MNRLQPIFSVNIGIGFLLLMVFMLAAIPVGSATIGTPLYQPKTPAGAIDYRQGVAALAKGDLDMAKQAFRTTLEKTPSHVGAMIGLAEIAFKEGTPDVTEKYIHDAMKVAPKNALIHQMLGRHLAQQGRLEEAENAYQQAIELEPKLMHLQLEVGDFYLQRSNQPQKAIEAYESALELDVSHAGAHFGLGSALANTGKIEQAIQKFQEAGQLAPDNPLPFFALGRIHLMRKQFEDAHTAFTQSIYAQPKFVQAYIARGDVSIIQERDTHALEDYEAARNISPNIPALHVKLGLLHERNKRFDQAVDSFRTAISLDPRQAIALNNLAWISVQHNTRLDEAVAWAKQAVALAPKVSAFQDTLGWVHRKRGELDEAADVLSKATTLEPEQADIFYHLGVVESERGHTEKAVAALEKALELNAKFADAEDARRRLQTLQKP